MKKLLLLFLFFALSAQAQDSAISTDKEKVKGKLSITMLRELKSSLSKNFGKNLDSLKVITIFYYQPKANCASDAYKFIKPDKPEPKEAKWVKSEVLYMCFEKGISSQYIKYDEGATVYNAFFSENRDCEGLVTVDSDGNYILIKKRGSASTANKFLEELQGKK
ncbi:MAG: hypothetical protein EOO50_08915 [Flavobacterium sp.]|uniref:hypothetical protein n=1 Tax=Flavobacterium sp. TaxID=239 RepID=UPI0011F7659C|nr:hypothetical protein [Flavobacterium sp.]RZJ66637.1 MAG: hypothetical protein EOO50_08915 [Flavobacterium sp.]